MIIDTHFPSLFLYHAMASLFESSMGDYNGRKCRAH